MHAVIIGTGGAGVSAIRTIRSLDEECKITAISKEKFLPYSPCSLPHMIAGEIDEKSIFRVRKDFFRKSRVRALFGRTVSRILARERAILVDGKKMSYDKLLVAAGSNPLRPSIPGIDLKGVYTLGNMTDAKQIMKWIEGGAKRAVVLGAGFIGVECAIALRKLGLEVSVYE
ncbi:MAG: FAD-dependent oxidoreductase, partial [Thermoplasmata archaeon]